MKRINFTRLSIQNFLSVGEEPVEIEFKPGVNIITGVNKDEDGIANGVGKSTVCAAFHFAIFGTTPNDIPKAHIINRKAGKGCKVRLEFEDNSSKHGEEYFVIERTLGPGKVKVFKNDVEKTKSTMPETNKYILEVLSADEEVFGNCIILQSNNTVPFMGQKKVDRKNFIEGVFNLGLFVDMTKLLKEDIREGKKAFDCAKTAASVMEGNIAEYKSRAEAVRREAASRMERMEAEKTALMERINASENEVESLKKRVLDSPDRAEDIKKLKDAKTKLEAGAKTIYGREVETRTKASGLEGERKRIQSIGDVCHACGRPYDADTIDGNKQRLAEIAETLKGYTESLAKLKEAGSEVAGKVGQCSAAIEALERAAREAENARQSLRYAEEALARHRADLERLPEKYRESEGVAAFDDLLKKTSVELEEKRKEIDAAEALLSRYNVCEHILGELGVRSYIVKKLIDMLNARIGHYLHAFKSTFRFTFNEFFEEEISDSLGAVCTYNNCSGAERKKIDLAISFAFLDILKYHRQTEYNIAFFDEILDSSVDGKSLEHIMEFIGNQAAETGKCVYIVTHKQDIAVPGVVETVFLEKRNGFTTRVDG